MPSIYRTKDRHGNYHPNWRIRFVNWQGERDGCVGLTSKAETVKLAWKIQSEHDEIRRGLRSPPKPSDKPRTFKEVADEYLAWGASQGGHGKRPWSKAHHRIKKTRLAIWEHELELKMISDLVGVLPRVERVLRELQTAGPSGRPCSGKTLQNYAETIASFCDWAVRREYLAEDPLHHLEGFDTSPTFSRRALTQDEVSRLLAVAPVDRRVVYVLAIITGLRAGELRQLLVSDFEKQQGWLKLRKVFTKNGKEGYQPLHATVVTDLLKLTEDMQPGDLMLHVPEDAAQMLYRDLEAAGIPIWTAEGKMDFHALRTSFATFVLESGANVKELQTLMRHSTPDLSMKLYARYREHPLQNVVSAVGDMLLAPNQTSVKQDAGEKSDTAANAVESASSAEKCVPSAEGSNPSGASVGNGTVEGRNASQTEPVSDVVSDVTDGLRTATVQSSDSLGRVECQTGAKQQLPAELSHLADIWTSLPVSARESMLLQAYRSSNTGSGFSGFALPADADSSSQGFSGFSGVAA